MLRSLAPLFAVPLLAGCTVAHHPTAPAGVVARSVAPGEWAALLADAAVVEHEAVTSARWSVPLSGLVDLDDPQAAALQDGDAPIVLPVHVLRHPVQGVFVIDTGVDRDLAAGGRGATGGLVSAFLSELEPVEALGDIVARQPAPLAGVLLTHMHLDHVLGLPDVPADTPIFVGPGEQDPRSAENLFLRGTYRRLLHDRAPLTVLDPGAPSSPGPALQAFDLLGDGSLWGLSVPGHTPGSMAWLANTADGPVLFTGDCSHTLWGWEHGVTPGSFTLDHDENAQSLVALRALAEALPGIEVHVGHELPGEPGPVAAR